MKNISYQTKNLPLTIQNYWNFYISDNYFNFLKAIKNIDEYETISQTPEQRSVKITIYNIPAPIKKLLKIDKIEYNLTQTFNKDTYNVKYNLEFINGPNILNNLDYFGSLQILPVNSNMCKESIKCRIHLNNISLGSQLETLFSIYFKSCQKNIYQCLCAINTPA